jgi:hypothetical protein
MARNLALWGGIFFTVSAVGIVAVSSYQTPARDGPALAPAASGYSQDAAGEHKQRAGAVPEGVAFQPMRPQVRTAPAASSFAAESKGAMRPQEGPSQPPPKGHVITILQAGQVEQAEVAQDLGGGVKLPGGWTRPKPLVIIGAAGSSAPNWQQAQQSPYPLDAPESQQAPMGGSSKGSPERTTPVPPWHVYARYKGAVIKTVTLAQLQINFSVTTESGAQTVPTVVAASSQTVDAQGRTVKGREIFRTGLFKEGDKVDVTTGTSRTIYGALEYIIDIYPAQ